MRLRRETEVYATWSGVRNTQHCGGAIAKLEADGTAHHGLLQGGRRIDNVHADGVRLTYNQPSIRAARVARLAAGGVCRWTYRSGAGP